MASTQSVDQQSTGIPFYRDERILKIVAQVISTIVIIGLLIWAALNFLRAAEARNMTLTFGFLKEAAGFPISNPPIKYEPSMSFGRAFFVGLVNTLIVSVTGIIAATILGTLIALARLSTNWLLNRIALVFVEFNRNIPLLVLLFILYFVIFQNLPRVKESIVWPGPIYLNQRGIYLTWPRLTETGMIFVILFGVGVVLAIIAYSVLRRRRELSGQNTYYGQISLGILVVSGVLGWVLSGTPFRLSYPELQGNPSRCQERWRL